MKVPTASRRHASRAGRQAHTGPTRGSVHLQQGVSTPAARARPRHERLKGKAGPTSAHPKKGSAAHLQRGPVPDAVARGRHRLATLPQQPHHRRLQVGVRSGRAEGAPCGVGERERAARQSSGIHQQSPFAYFQTPVPSPPPPPPPHLEVGVGACQHEAAAAAHKGGAAGAGQLAELAAGQALPRVQQVALQVRCVRGGEGRKVKYTCPGGCMTSVEEVKSPLTPLHPTPPRDKGPLPSPSRPRPPGEQSPRRWALRPPTPAPRVRPPPTGT